MSYLVLARKWRPQSLKDLIGQEHVARTLSNAIASDRVHHAFLFTGARGVGKTSAARILAKALNCLEGMSGTPCQACDSCIAITAGNDVDVIEIDGASNTGVDDVRELRENIRYLPARARYKIFIIDEVHMLSINAFNALLKTLEEPPPHAKFILATTEPHKIPITIHSRCQRFDFRKIGIQLMADHLRRILDSEGVRMSDQAVALVARRGEGSMRDSLSTLDQVLAFCGNQVEDDEVESLLGMVDKHLLFSMAEAVLERDSYRVLDTVLRVDTLGYSYRQVVRELIEFFRILVILQATDRGGSFLDITPDQLKEARRLADAVEADDLQRMVMILIKAEPEFRSSPFPRLALEMILLRLAKLPKSRDVGDLLARLDGLQPAASSRISNPSSPSQSSQSSHSCESQRSNGSSRTLIPAPDNSQLHDYSTDRSQPNSTQQATHQQETPSQSPSRDYRSPEPSSAATIPNNSVSSNRSNGYTQQPTADKINDSGKTTETVMHKSDNSMDVPVVAEGEFQDWRGFVKFVIGKKRVLGNCIEHGHIEKFALPDIEVGYPASASFNSELARDTENLEILHKLGKEYFSREINIKIIEVNTERAPTLSLVEERNIQVADKKKTCEDEVRGNTVIQSILNAFSGKIVKITPHQQEQKT